MKKVIVLLVSIMAVCLLFAACNCEHQYEEKITVEASCTVVGAKTFTCTKCNESYTEEIPMVEHAYTGAITKDPTCAEKGVNTFTCTVCNDSYTEEIEMIAHTFGEATITKDPTCVAEGEKTATCTACGATEVAEKIPTVAHSYQSKVRVAATCTEKGVNTLTCSVCNDSKEEATKALGHNHKQSKVITKVTCTSDGEVTMTCSRCKDSYNETKKATGHKWVDATCTKAKHCKNCNQKEGEALGHNYKNGTCTKCGQGFKLKFKHGFPYDMNIYARGTLYATVRFADMNYKVTDNGDGTVDLEIQFKGGITEYTGTSANPFASFWINGLGRSNVASGFYSTVQATGWTTIKNIPIGEYTISVSPNNR